MEETKKDLMAGLLTVAVVASIVIGYVYGTDGGGGGEDSVYDLDISGETIKSCYSQYGTHIVLISAKNSECYNVMNWFMDHGYKHTGELIGGSYESCGGVGCYKSLTVYIILTR